MRRRFRLFYGELIIVAHPYYVRSIRVLPRGPESTELTVDWYLPPGVAERFPEELERMCAG